MKFETAIRRTVALLAGLLSSSPSPLPAIGRDKKDKDKAAPRTRSIDSGSFGVFVKGQRVATETFHIEQQAGNSVIKSQLKETAGGDPVSQKSNLEITPSGELLRYEWSQSSGGSLTVFPDNDFLKERITASPNAEARRAAFPAARRTPILDNNFFIHREVLAWRYLAVAPAKTRMATCTANPPTSAHWFPRTELPCRSAWLWWAKKKSRSVAPSANCCA